MRFSSFIWASFLPTEWVMRFATVFGMGRLKYVPGWVGSMMGILWYITVFTSATGLSSVILLLVTLYLAAGICGEAANRLGEADPDSVVLDTFVVMPICFFGLSGVFQQGKAWMFLLMGLVLFQLLVFTKPFWIDRIKQIEGGWKILLDDVAAALVTCFLLNLIVVLGWL